jgi:hypothetical protein
MRKENRQGNLRVPSKKSSLSRTQRDQIEKLMFFIESRMSSKLAGIEGMIKKNLSSMNLVKAGFKKAEEWCRSETNGKIASDDISLTTDIKSFFNIIKQKQDDRLDLHDDMFCILKEKQAAKNSLPPTGKVQSASKSPIRRPLGKASGVPLPPPAVQKRQLTPKKADPRQSSPNRITRGASNSRDRSSESKFNRKQSPNSKPLAGSKPDQSRKCASGAKAQKPKLKEMSLADHHNLPDEHDECLDQLSAKKSKYVRLNNPELVRSRSPMAKQKPAIGPVISKGKADEEEYVTPEIQPEDMKFFGFIYSQPPPAKQQPAQTAQATTGQPLLV